MRRMRGVSTIAFVPGSYPMKDEKNFPIIATTTIQADKGFIPTTRKGDVIWVRPKPITHALHFKTMAGRRRAMDNFVKQAAEVLKDKGEQGMVFIAEPSNLILYADPKDIIRVPVYRGFEARYANLMRAHVRREKRQ